MKCATCTRDVDEALFIDHRCPWCYREARAFRKKPRRSLLERRKTRWNRKLERAGLPPMEPPPEALKGREKPQKQEARPKGVPRRLDGPHSILAKPGGGLPEDEPL